MTNIITILKVTNIMMKHIFLFTYYYFDNNNTINVYVETIKFNPFEKSYMKGDK